MPETEEIPATYADATRTLVRWHAEGGPPDLRIFVFPDPSAEMVRLVEVSDEFVSTGVVRPLVLGSSRLFPFRSGVALVSPDEWSDVESGRLALPAGWDLSAKEQVWP